MMRQRQVNQKHDLVKPKKVSFIEVSTSHVKSNMSDWSAHSYLKELTTSSINVTYDLTTSGSTELWSLIFSNEFHELLDDTNGSPGSGPCLL